MFGKALFLFALLTLAVVSAAPTGIARIDGTSNAPGAYGWVKVVKTLSAMEYTYSIAGLPEGLHALHVHQYGDLRDYSGSSTGGHFNPLNVPHSCFPNATRHAGDLFNITTDVNGIAESLTPIALDFTADLMGNLSVIGRAITIHQDYDDCMGASGNAGARIAFGVIGIADAFGDEPSATNHSYDTAVAMITGTVNSTVRGQIVLKQVNGVVQGYAELTGVEYGNHGFHIHEFGDASSEDALNMGGHFNPLGVVHGYPLALLPNDPAPTHHAGDMGNAKANTDGDAFFYLQWDPTVSLYDIVGRGVVLHEFEDNGSSYTGGSRVAMGVFGIANPAVVTPIDYVSLWEGTYSDEAGGEAFFCIDPTTNKVQGSYSGIGVFSGILNGAQITGTFWEAEVGGTIFIGEFTLTLNDDGLGFTGTWTSDDSTTPTGIWNAEMKERLSPPLKYCLAFEEGPFERCDSDVAAGDYEGTLMKWGELAEEVTIVAGCQQIGEGTMTIVPTVDATIKAINGHCTELPSNRVCAADLVDPATDVVQGTFIYRGCDAHVLAMAVFNEDNFAPQYVDVTRVGVCNSASAQTVSMITIFALALVAMLF